MSAAPFPDELTGRTIDGLELRALVGRGGMGEVYKAWDPRLERAVALKIVSLADMKDRDLALRFEREARAVSGLSHPNIAHVYATGRYQGRPYFVMELVEGRSLAEVLESEGRLSGLKCLDYLKQVAEGLRAAFDQGVIHRDIKPENLLVDEKGRLKIVDFGLARRLEGDVRVTRTSMVVGTPRYMSPEQATDGEVDHRSDIYSLGACFYHLFAGAAPFDAETPVALLMKQVGEPLVPLKTRQPNVPQGIASIVDRMLAKRPDDRYASYDELLADVDAARSGRLRAPAPAPQPPGGAASIPAGAAPEETGRSWGLTSVVVLGALALAYLAFQKRDRLLDAARTAMQPDPSDAPAIPITYTGEKPTPAAAPRGAIPASWDAAGAITTALRVQTLARMRRLATSCQVYMSEHDEMPAALSDIVERNEISPQELRDGWAHEIRYARTSPMKFRLASDGPDGRPGTDDDIVMENSSFVQGDVALPAGASSPPPPMPQRVLDPTPAPPTE